MERQYHRRSGGRHDHCFEAVDRNGVRARAETESEKMGRPGDDQIQAGVDWSEQEHEKHGGG